MDLAAGPFESRALKRWPWLILRNFDATRCAEPEPVSSWAPCGPRNRSRPSVRMRFNCANLISIFLR